MALSGQGKLTSRRAPASREKQHLVDILGARFVRDPTPDTDDEEEFRARRDRLQTEDASQCGSWVPYNVAPLHGDLHEIGALWPALDRIEYWVDPDPNGQLALLWLLNWIDCQGFDPTKLNLFHGLRNWAETNTGEPGFVPPPAEQTRPALLPPARKAWLAFRSPTPERWLSLLEEDLSALPFLRKTVVAMLHELPDATTGLAASERQLLALIAAGAATPSDVQVGMARSEPRALDFWEIGKLLDLLAGQPDPAIDGLQDGPFDLDFSYDESRRNRYFASQLHLSKLGCALLDGHADFAVRGRINRWWGGTHLTNEHCWRWDAERQRLVAPA